MVQACALEFGADGARTEGSGRLRAVLLVNIGTPDGADEASVRRYLVEFLSDPYVIQLPRGLRWFQRPLARLIAWRRGPQSAGKYQAIWTERGSPLRVIMQEQADALSAALPPGWRVVTAMRYGRPSIADALGEIAGAGIGELVVVPLYPQFSRTTTGTVVHELYRVLPQCGAHLGVAARTSWHDDAGYLNAQARRIAEFAERHQLRPERTILLYSAHGLPVAYVERGDPYAEQVRRSIELITQRLGWPAERTVLAFQSRFGPQAWLGPSTADVLAELAGRGETQVLLCPMSFAVDCLETLEEIDRHYRPQFEALGGRLYRCPALNAFEPFIDALKNLVVRGPQPVARWNGKHTPLIAATASPRADKQLERLFMVGVSRAGQIGPGKGPRVVYSDPEVLRCVRRPRAEVQEFLERLRADGAVSEALVWNTCQRFEVYGWLDDASEERACAIARIRRDLLGEAHGGASVNVLFGTSAWHHLLRTIVGLNSGLPGDKDIVEQFAAAYQPAERGGSAGPRLKALVEEALALAREARGGTAWGRATTGYCYAALDCVARALDRRLANCRHVVVGGSATSRSVLRALFERCGVHEGAVTLVYRAHQGGQMKQLRTAIGNGRRIRTDAYDARDVLSAIAEADLVYYGIDADEPVLTAAELVGRRDFAARPLVIVDFNSAGSTRGIEQIPGVTVWSASRIDAAVGAFARELVAQRQFPRLVQEAEAWVSRHAPVEAGVALPWPCVRAGGTVNPPCVQCGRDRAELSDRRVADAVRT